MQLQPVEPCSCYCRTIVVMWFVTSSNVLSGFMLLLSPTLTCFPALMQIISILTLCGRGYGSFSLVFSATIECSPSESEAELAIGRSCRPSRARPDRDFMLPVGIGLGIIKRNPGPGRIGLSDLKCRSGSVQTKI